MKRPLWPFAYLFPVLLAGCAQPGPRPEYTEVRRVLEQAEAAGGHPGRPVEPMAAALGPLPAPPELAGPQPVEAYIARALAENRAVQAARFDLLAMKERIPQVTALDDPTVENTIWPFPNNAPQYSIMGYGPYSLMVRQQFPWLGTLRLRGEAAAQDVQVALAKLCAAQLDVVARVKRAYYGVYQAERSAAVLVENRGRAEQFVEIALVRLEGGNTSQQDVLRAQNVVTEVDAELATVRQELTSARAALARQLHVAPESDLRTLAELPPAVVPAQVDLLYALATTARPELRGQLATVARGTREVELARKKYYPDVSVGLGYMTMTRENAESDVADGRDNFGLVVGFNLPIYRGKLDAGVREAEARAVADAKRYEDLRDETLEEVKASFADAQARREVLGLFRDTYLGRSRQALEVAAVDYRTGDLDFLTLITAWRELLQVELQIVRVEADLGRAMATLERAVGTRLAEEPHASATLLEEATEPPPPAAGPGPFTPPEGPAEDDNAAAPADRS